MSFDKKIKTRWNDPATGGFKLLEMSAKDIVANPLRHEFEPIVSAICACVDELIKREEAREERLKNMLMTAKIETSSTLELSPEINEGVN